HSCWIRQTSLGAAVGLGKWPQGASGQAISPAAWGLNAAAAQPARISMIQFGNPNVEGLYKPGMIVATRYHPVASVRLPCTGAASGAGAGGGSLGNVGGLAGCLANAAFRKSASSGGACRLNAMQKLYGARRGGRGMIGPAVRGVYGDTDCGTNPYMAGEARATD